MCPNDEIVTESNSYSSSDEALPSPYETATCCSRSAKQTCSHKDQRTRFRGSIRCKVNRLINLLLQAIRKRNISACVHEDRVGYRPM